MRIFRPPFRLDYVFGREPGTPFTKAGDREWAWTAYAALLQRRIQEGIFDEPFSLNQIYVPLNAYYLEETTKKDSREEMKRTGKRQRRVVTLTNC
jgi:hypothetical protein